MITVDLVSDTTTPENPLSTRTSDVVRSALELIAIAAVVLLIYGHLHPAHAATDHTPELVSAAGEGWDVFVTDGPLWGALVAANVGLQLFMSRQHWLAQGRLLAAITGLGMVLVAVIKWHLDGAPSSGIMTALVAAIALVVHPTVRGADPTATRPPSIRSGTLGILLGLCIVAALPSACGGSQDHAETITSIDTGILTARAAVRTYELEHARAIIESTPDKPARAAPLAELRARVDKVVLALDAATIALDAARGASGDSGFAVAKNALANALADVAALTGGAR